MAVMQRILVLGYGSVAHCFVPLLIKFFGVPPRLITAIDLQDKRERVAPGVQFAQHEITKDNYNSILSKYVQEGDLIIDLGLNIDSVALITWCASKGVHLLNSALVSWDSDPAHATNFNASSIKENLFWKIRNAIKTFSSQGPTAILTHGANPGLSAHFVKKALCDLAVHVLKKRDVPNKQLIERSLADKQFAHLAAALAINVVHIAEYDGHLINVPKRMNEFVNTWSPSALMQECIDVCQIGWGTHEKRLPKKFFNHPQLPHYVLLPWRSLDMFMYSWVPSGEIIGMIVPHEDIFEFVMQLSVYNEKQLEYCPTICYVYRMCDAAILSLQELQARRLRPQDTWRVVTTQEIVAGSDQLGAVLMGNNGTWWTGSVLDITQVAALLPNQNACTMQVAAGLAVGFDYICKNPNKGICMPFDIDHEYALKVATPFLGTMISQSVEWSPLALANSLLSYEQTPFSTNDAWQFNTFLSRGTYGINN